MRVSPNPDSGYGRPEKRFWAKVNKQGVIHPTLGQCCIWTAGCFSNGYGQFSTRSGNHRSHRYSWILKHGNIPIGVCVLHRCDNILCVNPEHLFLGSQADNIHDMVSKDRHTYGATHGSRTKPERVRRGSNHGMSKLTEQDIISIRALYRYRSSEFGSYGLARRYGVSQHLIMCILKNKNWKHVGK